MVWQHFWNNILENREETDFSLCSSQWANYKYYQVLRDHRFIKQVSALYFVDYCIGTLSKVSNLPSVAQDVL